jgi:hypothetical protein
MGALRPEYAQGTHLLLASAQEAFVQRSGSAHDTSRRSGRRATIRTVTEPDRLVQLIESARERVRSVRATLIERRRPALLERAFRDFAQQVDVASGGGYFPNVLGGVAAGEYADEHVWQIELWAEPTRFRQERTGPDALSTLVVDGEKWWEWSPAFGLRSHDHETGIRYHGGLDLLDPAPIVAQCTMEVAGEALAAGRQAIRIYLRGCAIDRGSLHLEPGIREVEILIDQSHGLILRRAQLVDGQEAAVLEAEHIAFDEELSPEVFASALPPGRSPLGDAQPHLTTIEDAGAQASFAVFALDDAAAEWQTRAVYTPESRSPTVLDSVTLIYSSDGATETVRIIETRQEHELPVLGVVSRFDREGRKYTALGPVVPSGREPTELIFALGTTNIRMNSSELSRERLLELSLQLVQITT